METTGSVHLKKKEDWRLLAGHLWIFSNEIGRIQGNPQNGDLVLIYDFGDKVLGVGYFSRNSLISVRFLSKEIISDFSLFLRERIVRANSRRKALGYSSSYRMVFGESDLLPGLVIDRYGDSFVIESFSAGADRWIGTIREILEQEFGAEQIVEKSDSVWRKHEGLAPSVRFLKGTSCELVVESAGVKYKIRPPEEQKTGLFLDQSGNRKIVQDLCRGRSVMDCFCHVGGFSIHAALGGADEVKGIDISEESLSRARENALLNGCTGIRFFRADVFEFLKCHDKGLYDLIILDPPAFVRNKKSLSAGLAAYRRINELALRLLKDDGILVTSSCSQHVSVDLFLEMLQSAASRQRKRLNVFSLSGASSDHPQLLSMPQTSYLKCVFAFTESL
jgi:23S rRNA (cytosine1962-C5)-methyltransferase